MGLTQKGRSRTWLADHGWWVCVVEFQPSGWSRGSYLNVGCMWLWEVKEHISFDEGYRVDTFHGFQNEEQFTSEAEHLARRAAQEVTRYRELFSSVDAVARYYLSDPPKGFWFTFHAAVACALTGRAQEARNFFAVFNGFKDEYGSTYVREAQEEAKQLLAIVEDTMRVRDMIAERIRRTRELQKLPAINSLAFE